MKVAFKTAAVLGLLLASLFITWVIWEIHIDGRAFRCTDEGTFSLGFWTSAETHQSAGDRIQPGWTWEKVARVNGFYKLAFLGLWIGGSTMAFRFVGETSRAELREHTVQL